MSRIGKTLLLFTQLLWLDGYDGEPLSARDAWAIARAFFRRTTRH